MTTKFEAMHGLAIKKFGTSEAIASILDANASEIETQIKEAVADGNAIEGRGAFMLTPKGQEALKEGYAEAFAAQRANAEMSSSYDAFELVNEELKQLITDWQMMSVAGESVPNDHSNADYDAGVIDRLGDLHERTEPILERMASGLARLGQYKNRLGQALDKVDEGSVDFVSGAKVDSYHTVWFEMHEDLIRILERVRKE